MGSNTYSCKDWTFRALTDIWTGDWKRQGDHLVPTGLVGSIRWWYEVLVRGLGGAACDPTGSDANHTGQKGERSVRCPEDRKKATEPGHHCVVCELFGCTGWARKFRVRVLDNDGNVIRHQIKTKQTFTLRFVPLRPIREEEWCLLDYTLRLIAEYGAIGGKTVLKPSDESARQDKAHHRDYGLVQYISGPNSCTKSCEDLKHYVLQTNWRREFADEAFSWASLQNFWCIKEHYLARQDKNRSTFNRIIGRPERKEPAQNGDSWLAGRRAIAEKNQKAESKKVFSFKYPEGGRRTFGFVKPGTVDFSDIKQRLRQVWPDLKDEDFLTGDEILKRLCGGTRL